MRKRFFVLLIVLSMLLAGCGGNVTEADVSGKVEPATEPAAEEVPAEETPVTMGRIEGGTYINEYAGYTCSLDSNWIFHSAEELQEIPDNVKELLQGTEVGDQLDTFSQFTDMMAENVNDLVTINVLYQKISLQERLAFAMMSESEIADLALEDQDTLITAYAQAGMEVETMEKVTVTFLGEERTCLRTSGMMEDIPFYILQLFDYHLGQYSVTLTVNSYMEDKTVQMLELFQPVE